MYFSVNTSYKMIMENIWGIDSEFIDPNTISVMISRLKKKITKQQEINQKVLMLFVQQMKKVFMSTQEKSMKKCMVLK